MTAKEKKAAEQAMNQSNSKEGNPVGRPSKKKDQDKKDKATKTKKGKNSRETPTDDSSTLGGVPNPNQFMGQDGMNPDFDQAMAGMIYSNNPNFPSNQGMIGSSMAFNQMQNMQGYMPPMGMPLQMQPGNYVSQYMGQ